MKRGIVQIDWIVSFGIFIIFLLLIFIWFGPGLSQDYSDEYLKTVAEKGFKEASFDYVYRYPIFIEGQGNKVYEVELPNRVKGANISQISLWDEGLGFIDERELDGDKIKFKYNPITGGVSTLYLLYSDSFNLTNVAPTGGLATNYNATVGVEERFFVFFDEKFNALKNMSYLDFKKALKYPVKKDIAVYIYDNMDFSNLNNSYEVYNATENDNVFVVSWADKRIINGGEFDDLAILIKVW